MLPRWRDRTCCLPERLCGDGRSATEHQLFPGHASDGTCGGGDTCHLFPAHQPSAQTASHLLIHRRA